MCLLRRLAVAGGGRGDDPTNGRFAAACLTIAWHHATVSYQPWPLADRDARPRLPAPDGAWISQYRLPFDAYAVGSLVPVVFERYARVFHPARAGHGDGAGDDRLVRWDDVAAWSGRTMHPLAQWDRLATPVLEPATPPPFTLPPFADGLPPDSLATLCDVLAAHTATPDDCFVGVWEGHGWPVSGWADPVVLDLEQRTYGMRRGRLALALRVGWDGPAGRVPEPPNILWPADRAWFVASDTDLDSTYVGGSGELIDVLVRHPDLEAWEIRPTDPITFDSDAVNAG